MSTTNWLRCTLPNDWHRGDHVRSISGGWKGTVIATHDDYVWVKVGVWKSNSYEFYTIHHSALENA